MRIVELDHSEEHWDHLKFYIDLDPDDAVAIKIYASHMNLKPAEIIADQLQTIISTWSKKH